MEHAVAEETNQQNAAEGAQLQIKENEYSMRFENGDMFESQEMRIPSDGDCPSRIPVESDCPESSSREFFDHPYTGLGFGDDGGPVVGELSARNHFNSNPALPDTSNNHGRMQPRQNQDPGFNLNQLAYGSGSGSSRANTTFNGQIMSHDLENVGYPSLHEIMAQRRDSDTPYDRVEELTAIEDRGVSSNIYAGLRTKVLSQSGFQFYVKNTLKGKGVICRGRPLHDDFRGEPRNTEGIKEIGGSTAVCDPPRNVDTPNGSTVICDPTLNLDTTNGSTAICDPTQNLDTTNGSRNICDPTWSLMLSSDDVNAVLEPPLSERGEVSLREWLICEHPKVNKVQRLSVFKQIVDLVDHFHSQGLALHELRPSFFKLLPSNEVKYVGSPISKDMLEGFMDRGISHSKSSSFKKKSVEQEFSSVGSYAKKQKISQNPRFVKQWPQFPTVSSFMHESMNSSHINFNGLRNRSPHTDIAAHQHLTSITEELEEKWYISPEEMNEGSCTVLSNIYSLGVLLFELLAHFDTNSDVVTAMSNVRHRILPPNFLSENAKEAGFCLWLLHPEPCSRPTAREILQSEVVNGLNEVYAEKFASSVAEEDAELELLSHFLKSLKQKKQKDASKLMESIRFLEADVEEVERRHCSKKPLIDLDGRKDACEEISRSDALSVLQEVPSSSESMLTRNIDQLESAYFSMRSRIQFPETDSIRRMDLELLGSRYLITEDEAMETPPDKLGAIFDGLCKYARYSKFEVRGVLRNGDFNSGTTPICSLSFDRDEDYFASAGVSKKIQVFEFDALFNDSVDIHYPAIEMSNDSRLSCVSWNNYIKNYLASADFDGLVKLWDVSTGQEFARYSGHEQKAWSVDFSQVYPTKLASASDDGSVKLWSINEKQCLGTIRNRNFANVCCVQFSPYSTNLLAFGSADFNTYCYDLRNARTPWCVLAGHQRSVSYVQFLDSNTLVSASTDHTLKLWDLNKSNPCGPSTNACTLTFSGHSNQKNFVGLSVSDGYIACGSETNEVYAYYRSLPMPITSHKFGSIDPISGKETDDINEQFVSSVCWRQKSDMVVAANSIGCIKVLQIV